MDAATSMFWHYLKVRFRSVLEHHWIFSRRCWPELICRCEVGCAVLEIAEAHCAYSWRVFLDILAWHAANVR